MKKTACALLAVLTGTSVVDAKTLVAYYSRTGNTASLANIIQAATNADIFEIKTADANYYPADYNEMTTIAKQEIADNKLVPINEIPDLSQYDTIFIGSPIDDVWGIGRRLTGRLNKLGIKTAYDFTQLPRSYVRKTMTITCERMWCELNGQSCINLEITAPDKKQICTSRSFGRMITQLDELAPAIEIGRASCRERV